jgi:two-component system chemotaxis response regulator CheV
MMLDVEKIVADIDPRAAMENVENIKRVEGKPKVVFAEDSITINKMINDKLQKAGYEVTSCKDGKEAWEQLLSIAQRVSKGEKLNDLLNIVVTDIEMPQMDGYSLTKNIKSNDILKNIPVIIFSSIISQDVLHKGSSVGADKQLSKPKMSELIDTVNQLAV